jgi:hypothetical protein
VVTVIAAVVELALIRANRVEEARATQPLTSTEHRDRHVV